MSNSIVCGDVLVCVGCSCLYDNWWVYLRVKFSKQFFGFVMFFVIYVTVINYQNSVNAVIQCVHNQYCFAFIIPCLNIIVSLCSSKHPQFPWAHHIISPSHHITFINQSSSYHDPYPDIPPSRNVCPHLPFLQNLVNYRRYIWFKKKAISSIHAFIIYIVPDIGWDACV